jgi:hypothetical protein
MPSGDEQGLTCLVTIHGIGFQQPPMDDGTAGYADGLHEGLARYLDPTVLNDDPNRVRSRPGEAGPIYVQSSWPPNSNNLEGGLERLGSWNPSIARRIDRDRAPLATHPGISHIALVYSQLEDRGAQPGSAFEASARAAVGFGHYATVRGAMQMMLGDAWALMGESHPQPGAPAGSLRVRTDLQPIAHHFLSGIFRRTGPGAATAGDAQSGLLSTIRHLEDDVAAYVCRNDLRERVRSFVREALLRLAYRDDVARIVVNSHSHGTVVAFDVLRELSYAAIPKVQWFVTCGSPLRKYSDLFAWGTEVGCIQQVRGWTNFWDPKDPVADPLAPSGDWKPGQDPTVPAATKGMYQALDPKGGQLQPMTIEDREVDNLTNSLGGGLQAHNYWDNDTEVVRPLAEILAQVASASAATAGRPVQIDSSQPNAATKPAEVTPAEQPSGRTD